MDGLAPHLGDEGDPPDPDEMSLRSADPPGSPGGVPVDDGDTSTQDKLLGILSLQDYFSRLLEDLPPSHEARKGLIGKQVLLEFANNQHRYRALPTNTPACDRALARNLW